MKPVSYSEIISYKAVDNLMVLQSISNANKNKGSYRLHSIESVSRYKVKSEKKRPFEFACRLEFYFCHASDSRDVSNECCVWLA